MSVRQKSPKQRANQEFNDAIKLILQHYSNLTRLQEYYFRNVKPGHYLKYNQTYTDPETGAQIVFQKDVYKKDVRMLNKQFRDEIKNLKVLFRKKKSRDVIDLNNLIASKPEGWVRYLKGQNRPSVATSNLVEYLNDENFGTVDPPQYNANGEMITAPSGGNLIERLPILKKGYGLKAAFALLFFHAIRVADVMGTGGGHMDNLNHRKNYFTPAMVRAFGDKPTPYRYTKWGPDGIEGGEQEGVKIPNEQTGFELNGRIYQYVPLSTIDYLARGKYSGGAEVRITREMAHLTVVQTILNLNIQDNDDITEGQRSYFENDSNVEAVVKEYIRARGIRKQWVDGMKPKTDLRRKEMRKSPRVSPRRGSASPLLGSRGASRSAFRGSASPL